MATRRVLLVGAGDLTAETSEALDAAGADVHHLEEPDHETLREAVEAGADAVVIVSREDAWPLRVALLVRHLDADVPIVVTIADEAVGRQLAEEIDNCTITSLADIVAPSLAGPCLDDDLAAVVDGDPPRGLRCDGERVEPAPLPEVRSRRVRALATAILQPFDRSAGLVFFGAVGLTLILIAETVSAAIVLEQSLVDAFYGAVKTLVTVDPNPEVEDGPEWYKVAVSISMLVALLFAAAFTGGLVERLIGRNLTGLVGAPRGPPLRPRGRRRARPGRAAAVPAAAPLRDVRGRRGRPGGGRERRQGARARAPRGGGPRRRSLAARPPLALARAGARRRHRRRPGEHPRGDGRAQPRARPAHRAARGQRRDRRRDALARGARLVRDVHRIGAVYLAGLALGSAADHVVVDGDRAHLRDDDGALERCPYPVAG